MVAISTTRPPFRIGYRKRSTTTPRPGGSVTVADTSTPVPRTTKPSRRKAMPNRSRTTSTTQPVESQATTRSPTRLTNRFKFVSRKPYLKTTTLRHSTANATDQMLEPTNQQALGDNRTVNAEASELTDIATVLEELQQAPIPQAKPSRKRPQILKLSSQYISRSTTLKPTSTTKSPTRTNTARFKSYTSPKFLNKKTVAITVPFSRGSYVTPEMETHSTQQTLTADKFLPTIVTAAPLVRQVYSSPQTISAQDFISRFTPSLQASTRSKSRYPTTEVPLVIITPSKSVKTRGRPSQAFQKISARAESISAYSPTTDYDYYDNIETSILGRIPENSKVLLHGNGIIECLDQGNFPHPVSCKKFISCAKTDNDKIIGWEYTCPKNLSFDPIGGMCNWSAGLGCNEA